MDGLSLVSEGRDNTGAAFVLPGSKTSAIDYAIELQQQKNKAAAANKTPADNSSFDGIKKAWYVDQPYLLQKIEEIKILDAQSLNPKLPEQERLNYARKSREQKGLVMMEAAKSAQQREMWQTAFNNDQTHPDAREQTAREQIANYPNIPLPQRGILNAPYIDDYNYEMELLKTQPLGKAAKDLGYDVMNDDGVTKTHVDKREFNEEGAKEIAHAMFNYDPDPNSTYQNTDMLTKPARAIQSKVRAIIHEKHPNLSQDTPQFQKMLKDWSVNMATDLIRRDFKHKHETTVSNAPSKIAAKQKSADEMATEWHEQEGEKGIVVDKNSSIGTNFKAIGKKEKAYTIPSDDRKPFGIVVDDNIILSRDNINNGEELDFTPAQIRLKKKNGVFKPYVIGKTSRTITPEKSSSNPFPRPIKKEFTVEIPLDYAKNSFANTNVQYQHAYEMAEKLNDKELFQDSGPGNRKQNKYNLKNLLPSWMQ